MYNNEDKLKMKITWKCICLLMLSLISIPSMSQKKQIIGYYPSWKWNRPHWLLTPKNIPYEKLTIINYAFFCPSADGNKLTGKDSIGDQLLLKGDFNKVAGKYLPNTGLVDLAHKHGVKVVVSIGGWDDSNNFPAVAASERTREAFAHACVEAIQTYSFDGIDIDWEFPCLVEHNGTQSDKQNYTKLLQITRDSLDSYGKQTNIHYLLTAALPATDLSIQRSFEIEKIVDILDMVNVMTYDLNGSWDNLSGHNSPLYPPQKDDTIRNIDAAFKLFTETYKVPALKVNLGVPFYAHTYKECTALFSPHKGADTIHFSPHGCFYYDIIECKDKFTRYWDDKAKVPYLVSKEWNLLISYDDAESVGYKAQYVIDKKACGLIIWEITGDYLANS
jgi:chitinase